MPPLLGGSRHLSPFALHTAFPCSLDGRHAVDYYEDSVTVGLAPRRRSRVPFSTERVEHDVGAPFIPLNRFVIDRLSGEGYDARKSNAPLLTASPVDAVATSVRFHRWGLGFRQCSFHHIAQVLQSPNPYTSSGGLRFTDMLLSLPPFRVWLVVHLEVISLELRSPVGTIHSARTMAHGHPVHGSSNRRTPRGALLL